ncbi:MAG: hypothetical protein ACYC09_10505 [Bacteroidota bacterium]
MKQFHKYSALFVLSLFILAGCKNDDPVSVLDSNLLYEDAAESISAAVGDESGGAVDNFADVMSAAGGGGFSTTLAKTGGDEIVTAGIPSYDSTTGWWTVTVDRSRSNMMTSGSFQRVFQFQFRKNGVVQKLRIEGSDTANTMKFKIVSGSGHFIGPRVKHYLTDLKGAWTVTDLDKDTVTLNSDTTYVRTGVDSIITRNMQRTFTHTLNITSMTDVRGPRFRFGRDNYATWRGNFSKAVSGTLEGTFKATITFQNGDLYRERSIDRSFTVTLGGGDGSISFGGNGPKFSCDLGSGHRRP